MKHPLKKIFTVACLFFGLVATGKAEVGADLFKYPEKLFKNGQYYRSISEIKRFQFYFPQKSAYYKLKLLLLKNYYRLADNDKVDQTAREIFMINPSQPFTAQKKDSAKILAFSLLNRGEEVKAQQVWEQLVVQKKEPDFPLSLNVKDQVDPEQAKLYSYIMPGMGLLTSGSYGKASASFLLNAIFLNGINNNLATGQLGIASLLFFFEWSWYFGGVRAAEEAAINYNQSLIKKARQDWISKQSSQLFN